MSQTSGAVAVEGRDSWVLYNEIATVRPAADAGEGSG